VQNPIGKLFVPVKYSINIIEMIGLFIRSQPIYYRQGFSSAGMRRLQLRAKFDWLTNLSMKYKEISINPIAVKSSGSSPELVTNSGAETTQEHRNLLFKLFVKINI
jgi:hypothetical protein